LDSVAETWTRSGAAAYSASGARVAAAAPVSPSRAVPG